MFPYIILKVGSISVGDLVNDASEAGGVATVEVDERVNLHQHEEVRTKKQEMRSKKQEVRNTGTGWRKEQHDAQ